jgi:cell division septation protein DedD
VEGDLEPASPEAETGEEAFAMAEAAAPVEEAAVEEAPAEEEIAEAAVVEEVDEYPAVTPEEKGPDVPPKLETAAVEEPEVTEGVSEEPARLVLVPSEPKPPASEEAAVEPEAIAAEAEPAALAAAKPLEITAFEASRLPADRKEGRTYFIQLGAYKSETLAMKVEDTYSERYPVAVLASASDVGAIYRVFIGPLNQDESGTLLHWFQAKGFRDAFLRSAH